MFLYCCNFWHVDMFSILSNAKCSNELQPIFLRCLSCCGVVSAIEYHYKSVNKLSSDPDPECSTKTKLDSSVSINWPALLSSFLFCWTLPWCWCHCTRPLPPSSHRITCLGHVTDTCQSHVCHRIIEAVRSFLSLIILWTCWIMF